MSILLYTVSLKAYKFRIYPTKSQETLLESAFETCRYVYNRTLALRKDTYDHEREYVSLYETARELTKWKLFKPELKRVHSQVLQNAQVRVDLAFNSFYRRAKEVKAGKLDPKKIGFPRFKGKERYDSITYPQYGSSAQIIGNCIHLSKIGDVRLKQHRDIKGVPKTVTISKRGNGKWYCSIACEVKKVVRKGKPRSPKVVGIDVGVRKLATLSDGTIIEPPRYLMEYEATLDKANRRLDKAPKGTPLRAKMRKQLGRVYELISNKRTDFTEKLSLKLVKDYTFIAFENLQIDEMVEAADCYCEKHIMDASWRKLMDRTKCKAEEAGTTVVFVDPRNTSQRCSQCGKIVKKSRSETVHKCNICGLIMDRDLNAAKNILALGLQCRDCNKSQMPTF